MGLWDDLKKAVQQTGEQALKKADAAVDAMQKSMETHETSHQHKLDATMAELLSGRTDVTPEQLAELRKFAFKPGKIGKPGEPPVR
jgi:predicted phage gp36 major capsid-like protein